MLNENSFDNPDSVGDIRDPIMPMPDDIVIIDDEVNEQIGNVVFTYHDHISFMRF